MYREPVPPSFEPLVTFNKGPVVAIRSQNRLFLVMAVMFGLLTLFGVVAMWVISGFSNVIFVMASPVVIVVVLLSIVRGKIRGAAELVVDVAYAPQVGLVRFTSPDHPAVDLPAADVHGLTFREKEIEAVQTVRSRYTRASFAIVAETPNGDVEITKPLICTGTGFIAAGRANLQKVLPEVSAKITAALPPRAT